MWHRSGMTHASKQIDKWLAAQDMLQRQLATRIGISKGQLSRIMNGAIPGILVRKALARETGLDIEGVEAWRE